MITARMTSRIPEAHIEEEVEEVALSAVAVVLEADLEEPTAEEVAQVKGEADPVIGETFVMLRKIAVEGIRMVEITLAIAKVDI